MSSKCINFNAYLAIIIFSFVLAGCIEDKCTAILCMNDGVCVNGRCACANQYEGDSCQIPWSEKFEGRWTSIETDKAGAIQRKYEVNAIYGLSPDTFFVLGLADTLDTVVCIRKAYTTFTILPKKWPAGDSIQGGEAVLHNETNTVTGLYSFVKGESVSSFSFTWSR